jgi:methionyl-tRNA synthetase
MSGPSGQPPANPTVDFITTAIVYPNSRIHVGWGWECVASDWLVRALQALGRQTFFTTGMDEHSIKVQRRAEAEGLTPQAYCDRMADDITRVLRQMGMRYDRFIRTSDADHHRVVEQLVKRSYENGDIYKDKYEGLYCEGCEAFYTEKDLVEGKCPAHGTPPKQVTEENYFFRLSKYQDKLLALYRDRPDFIQPAYRRAEIVNFVEAGLKDFSVSRSTFTWGIPFPFDPKHVVYVWFDALINYLTAAGVEHELRAPGSPEAKAFRERWPASYHIVGKDISRFHCVYWPAMLMSCGIELPRRVFIHGFITLKGERMSKSSGQGITPDAVMAVTGADPFRYFMLAENDFSQDGNFTWEALVLKNNADLANDWGNLVNRSISMTRKYFPGRKLGAPAQVTHSAEVRKSFEALPAELADAVARVDTIAYARACTARSRVLNLYIDKTKPWALAKAAASSGAGATATATATATAELEEVMFTLLEGIRWVATALLPVLPFGMPEVFRQLQLPEPKLEGALPALRWGELQFEPGEPKPVYPRLELPVAPD